MGSKCFYFITDDTLNEKNLFLYNYLSKTLDSELVLLAPQYAPMNKFGYRQVSFKSPKRHFFNHLWSKAAFFFSKKAGSKCST